MRSTFIFALISLMLVSVLAAGGKVPGEAEKGMEEGVDEVKNLLTTEKVVPPKRKPGEEMMKYVDGWKQRKAEKAAAAAKLAQGRRAKKVVPKLDEVGKAIEAPKLDANANAIKESKLGADGKPDDLMARREKLRLMKIFNMGDAQKYEEPARLKAEAKAAAKKTAVGAEAQEQRVIGGKEGKEEIEPKPVNVVQKAEGKGPIGSKKAEPVVQPPNVKKTVSQHVNFFEGLSKESNAKPVVPPKVEPVKPSSRWVKKQP